MALFFHAKNKYNHHEYYLCSALKKRVAMKIKSIFKTIFIWFIIIVSMATFIVVYIVLWLVSLPFDKKKFFIQKITQFWAAFYVWVFPFWTVEIIGKEKLKRNKACIAVSNHQSMGDIIFLFKTYAYFIWVSKIENFRMPVLGWVMTLNNYISLKRDDPKTFPKMFEDISKALKENKTIMIFPEGTRSRNMEVGRFKDGAFKAAIDNKVSIIPIVLDGSGKTVKRDPSEKGKIKIIIKVLDEIPYNLFPTYNPTELKDYVRNIIIKELETLRASRSNKD